MMIELTDNEARLFRAFQEHHETFYVLYNSGMFDVRNGTALVNFDAGGSVSDIDVSFKLYKRGKPVIIGLQQI